MKRFWMALCIVVALIVSGCSTIDKEERLTGIVDACYTAYEYNQKDDIEPYLENRVKDGEISSETKFVILKCIERGQKNE